jgi:hypothetical protein
MVFPISGADKVTVDRGAKMIISAPETHGGVENEGSK